MAKMDIMKAYELIENMAKNIFDMENDYDSSMRGVFMDIFITEYVKNHGTDFCNMFDYITTNQFEDYKTYGDIDESVKKLKVEGDLGGDNEDYNNEAIGMYLRDIFSGNNFIIIKVIRTHTKLQRFTEVEYHCRKIFKELKVKKIKYKKYVQYGDTRDDGYVVSFRIPHFDRLLEVKDKRGMSSYYTKFMEALRTLKSVHYQMTNK